MRTSSVTASILISTFVFTFCSIARADYYNTSGNKERAIKQSGAYRQEFDRRMSGKTGFENTLNGIQALQKEMQQADDSDARAEAARNLANQKRMEEAATKDQIYEEYGPAIVLAMISNNEEVYLNAVNDKPSIWTRAFSLVHSRSKDGTVAQDVSRIRALQGLLSYKVIPKPPRDYGEMYATGLQPKHIEDSVDQVQAIIKAEKKGEFNDAKLIYTPEIAYILGKLYMYGYRHRKDKDKDYEVEPDVEKAFEYFKLSASYMNLKIKTITTDAKTEVAYFEDEHKNTVATYMNNMIIQSAYEVIRCYRDGVGTKKDLAMAKKTAVELFEKLAPLYKNRPAEFLVNTSAFKASQQTNEAAVLRRSGYIDVKDVVEGEYRKIYYAEGSENRKAELKLQEEQKKKLEEEQKRQAEEKNRQAIENEKIARIEKMFSEPAYQQKKAEAVATMEKLIPSVLARVSGAQEGAYDSFTYFKVVKPSLEDDRCVAGKCYLDSATVPLVLIQTAQDKYDVGFGLPALVVLAEEISGLLDDVFKTIPKNPKLSEQLFLDLEKIDDSSEYLLNAKAISSRELGLLRPRIYFRLFQIYSEGIGVAKNRNKASLYLKKCLAHAAGQSESTLISHSTARVFSAFCAMEAAKVKSQSSEMANLAARLLVNFYGTDRGYYRNYQNYAYSSVKGILQPAIDKLIKK